MSQDRRQKDRRTSDRRSPRGLGTTSAPFDRSTTQYHSRAALLDRSDRHLRQIDALCRLAYETPRDSDTFDALIEDMYGHLRSVRHLYDRLRRKDYTPDPTNNPTWTNPSLDIEKELTT